MLKRFIYSNRAGKKSLAKNTPGTDPLAELAAGAMTEADKKALAELQKEAEQKTQQNQ